MKQQGSGRGQMMGAGSKIAPLPSCSYEGRVTCHYTGTQLIKGKLFCQKHASMIHG